MHAKYANVQRGCLTKPTFENIIIFWEKLLHFTECRQKSNKLFPALSECQSWQYNFRVTKTKSMMTFRHEYMQHICVWNLDSHPLHLCARGGKTAFVPVQTHSSTLLTETRNFSRAGIIVVWLDFLPARIYLNLLPSHQAKTRGI